MCVCFFLMFHRVEGKKLQRIGASSYCAAKEKEQGKKLQRIGKKSNWSVIAPLLLLISVEAPPLGSLEGTEEENHC